MQLSMTYHRDILDHLIGIVFAFVWVGGFVAWNAPKGNRSLAFLLGGCLGLFFVLLDAIVGVWGFAVIFALAIWLFWRGESGLALTFVITSIFFYGVG